MATLTSTSHPRYVYVYVTRVGRRCCRAGNVVRLLPGGQRRPTVARRHRPVRRRVRLGPRRGAAHHLVRRQLQEGEAGGAGQGGGRGGGVGCGGSQDRAGWVGRAE